MRFSRFKKPQRSVRLDKQNTSYCVLSFITYRFLSSVSWSHCNSSYLDCCRRFFWHQIITSCSTERNRSKPEIQSRHASLWALRISLQSSRNLCEQRISPKMMATTWQTRSVLVVFCVLTVVTTFVNKVFRFCFLFGLPIFCSFKRIYFNAFYILSFLTISEV